MASRLEWFPVFGFTEEQRLVVAPLSGTGSNRHAPPTHPSLPRAAMTWYHYVFIAAEVVSLALVPVILLQRKEPTSTFAWILTLIFLPILGTVLYLMFGRTTIREAGGPGVTSDADVAAPVPMAPDVAAAAALRLERDCYRVAEILTGQAATDGNHITVLIDGDETYAAIGAALDAACGTIHAEYYLIKDDAIGIWFAERLAAAAKRGVTVRLLRDGFGSFALGSHWLAPLAAAGVMVRTFLPMHGFMLRPASLRDHRKIIVVDDRIAFTGGINICDEHSRLHFGATSWRDLHLRLEGPAVAQVQRIFGEDWRFVTGENVLPASSARKIQEKHEPGAVRAAIIPSGPDTRTEAIHRVFFAALAGAAREILITSPYFAPDDAILVAIEIASLRGVAVTLVVPAHSNHPTSQYAGRSLYQRLLDAGVRICEYQPAMIHAKTMLIDGRLALIGSANMDLRSFRLNFEIHALIDHPAVVGRLRGFIDEVIADSRVVDPAQWNRRGVTARIAEGAARLLSPLL